MRINCEVCVTSDESYLNQALLQLDNRYESCYQVVTIPFEYNIFGFGKYCKLSPLSFKNEDLEIIMRVDITKIDITCMSSFQCDMDVNNIYIKLSKNGNKIVDKNYQCSLMGAILDINNRELRTHTLLTDYIDMKESEIYINFITFIINLGGDVSIIYKNRLPECKYDSVGGNHWFMFWNIEVFKKELDLAKSGLHPCPTALEGLKINRMKSAR